MKLRLAILAGLAFLVGCLAAIAIVPGARDRLLAALSPPSIGKALVGGPFSLLDQDGRRVTDQDFRGRYMLVLFGFTYCPDVCPSGLQVISAALDKLGSKSSQIQPVFISIDPERDTPPQLKQYVASFHARLVGLTGSAADIEAVTKAYRVYVKKVADAKSSVAYTIDHSALIYLMGPEGQYVTHFNHATGVDKMVERLQRL